MLPRFLATAQSRTILAIGKEGSSMRLAVVAVAVLALVACSSSPGGGGGLGISVEVTADPSSTDGGVADIAVNATGPDGGVGVGTVHIYADYGNLNGTGSNEVNVNLDGKGNASATLDCTDDPSHCVARERGRCRRWLSREEAADPWGRYQLAARPMSSSLMRLATAQRRSAPRRVRNPGDRPCQTAAAHRSLCSTTDLRRERCRAGLSPTSASASELRS